MEVLNAAVGSYSPIIYLRKIEYLLQTKTLKFNHVLVMLDISDIQDEAEFYEFDEKRNVVARKQHYLDREAYKNAWDKKFKEFLSNNTVIYANLRIWFHTFRNRTIYKKSFSKALNIRRSSWTVNPDIYNQYGKDGLKTASKHLTQLHNLLRNQGIGMTLAVYPWPDQIWNRDLDSIQVNYWEKWSQESGVNFINLFPYFIKANMKDEERNGVLESLFIPGDVHWNKAGHKIVFNALLENLNLDSNQY